jgi:hypothetical protein
MTADYKALCAELLQGLDENRHPEVRYPGHLRLVMARARAALAEEAVGPTTQQLNDLICDQLGYEHFGTGNNSQSELFGTLEELRSLAVAAIASWGCPADAPRPIPVAERLEALETLARDAVSALRYIEQQHGRLYGVGWDRVFDAAAAIPLPKENNE